MIEEIQLSAINRDTNNQMRDGIRDDVVDEYADAMRGGATFPPVVVFADGGNGYHLADGFHRVEAARVAGVDVIQADVRDGDHRDARLYAAGANATHGLRRTNADKRRSVMALLEDDEWSQMGDREIARHCGVTHPFVGKMRSSQPADDDPQLIEGRKRLNQISLMRIERTLHQHTRQARQTIPATVAALDDVRSMLTPEQYDEWLRVELKKTPEWEIEVRAAVASGNGISMLEAMAGITTEDGLEKFMAETLATMKATK